MRTKRRQLRGRAAAFGRAAGLGLMALTSLIADAGPSRLVWDRSSLSLLEAHGGYGRMARLKEGTLFFACERDGKICSRRSSDAGCTWSATATIAEWTGGRLANPELLQLKDGTVLCFHNRRPDAASQRPYAIAVSRLKKGAAHWSVPDVIYEAGAEFENGCWEPAAVQLPDGSVLLFFANEAPYRNSQEQEISLLRSFDGAATWTGPERVAFRKGCRDGMPAPLVLANGAGVAVAIEDNGFCGRFKPVIVFSPLADVWRSGAVTGTHPRRWGALADPLPDGVYAGAPYLRRLASGETILSFQRSDDGEMSRSRIVVCAGDASARGFAEMTYPFPETSGSPQLWASLCVKDARTVTVLATATIDGVAGVWSIDGRLEK